MGSAETKAYLGEEKSTRNLSRQSRCVNQSVLCFEVWHDGALMYEVALCAGSKIPRLWVCLDNTLGSQRHTFELVLY